MSNSDKPACRHHALVVGAPCAGAQRRRQHLRPEGHRLRYQRSRSVRGGRKDPAAQRGLVSQAICKRTHQTAEAIWAAGFPKPATMPHEAAFAEQHLGEWQGMNRAAFIASRPVGSHWFADINEPAPGGESFMDLYNRTCGAIERITAEQAGRDVIAVAHGGTIKAAVGLALGGDAGKGPCLRHRQLLGDAARSFRKRRAAASGGCRWSTSSHGSRMPRTPRCISRRDRRSCRKPSSPDASVVGTDKDCLARNDENQSRRSRTNIWERMT